MKGVKTKTEKLSNHLIIQLKDKIGISNLILYFTV